MNSQEHSQILRSTNIHSLGHNCRDRCTYLGIALTVSANPQTENVLSGINHRLFQRQYLRYSQYDIVQYRGYLRYRGKQVFAALRVK